MKHDPERAEHLVETYLQGTLTGAEQAELDRVLAEDPDVARLLVKAAADESLLRELFGGADRLRRLANEAPAAAKRTGSRAHRRRAAGFAAAAVAAIALAVLFVKGEPALATVVRAEGAVRFAGGGAAAVGAGVAPGAGLETLGAASSASIRFHDGTRVDLGAGTLLARIDEDESGRRLRLERGDVTVDTKRPLTLQTRHAEARVLGTLFTITVAKDATRLEVNEGKVRLTRSDGKGVDVTSGHFAVAAAGVELAARPVASKPSRGAAFIADMPPNSWRSVPGTRLRQVVPDPAKYPEIQGDAGPPSVIDCWSGGALDTRRGQLVVWGGGSDDYRGNEIYAFKVDTLAWERLTEPTRNPVDAGQKNADGTPNARATYNGLAYLAHADRFFAAGGDLGATTRQGHAATLTWTFDFDAKRWTDRDPAGAAPPMGLGNTCAYDPATKKLWWGESNLKALGLYSYDYDSNAWTKHNSDHFYYHTSAVDTRRSLLVGVGNGKVFAYDLRGGRYERQDWTTTGGERVVTAPNPGLDYDPVADRLVGWAGGAVYALHPETKVWSAHDAPGAPPPSKNGIYGRWRYVPSVRAFIVVTGIDQDVHFYKLAP